MNQTEDSFEKGAVFSKFLEKGWLTDSLEKVFEEIKSLETDSEIRGISPYVVSSVLWSLVSFARNPYFFWKTIETALYPSGDVDSTAAMAGNLSGVFLGIDAIPYDMRIRINDQGKRGYEYFMELGKMFANP